MSSAERAGPALPLASIRTMTTPEQRKRNNRLGLILGTVALVFFVGFIARMVLLGG